MRFITYRRFPCTYNSGRLITFENCERCRKSQSCDIYAIMLDDNEED